MKCEYFFREFQKLFFNHQKRKKMKKNILNLEGVTVLTKQQQKVVNGGAGTCAVRYDNGVVMYNIDKALAVSQMSNGGTNWCCDSCASASWFGGAGLSMGN